MNIFHEYLSDGTPFKVVKYSNLRRYIKVSQPRKWGILDVLTVEITILTVTFFDYGKVEILKYYNPGSGGILDVLTVEITVLTVIFFDYGKVEQIKFQW
jgi:hypothetical protein